MFCFFFQQDFRGPVDLGVDQISNGSNHGPYTHEVVPNRTRFGSKDMGSRGSKLISEKLATNTYSTYSNRHPW